MLIDRITTSAFSLWWEHRINGTSASAPHLARILPALGEVNSRMTGAPLLDWLRQRLGHESLRVGPQEAISEGIQVNRPRWWILGRVCASVFRKRKPNPVAQATSRDDFGARVAAAEAVGQLGPSAATPEFLARLAEWLGDPSPEVRRAAAEAVGQLGPAAAPEHILARLAGLLADPDSHVRGAAVWAVGGLGACAATPDILDHLTALVHNAPWEAMQEAAQAIARLGPSAAIDTALACLTVRFTEPYNLFGVSPESDIDLRLASVDAIRFLARSAPTPEFLARLAEWLGDPSPEVRRAAAEAVGELAPPAAATEHILARLAALLGDPDSHVREAAVLAVGRLGPAAATEHILARVAELLRYPDVVGRMMAQGVRIFQVEGGRWEARTVAELSQL